MGKGQNDIGLSLRIRSRNDVPRINVLLYLASQSLYVLFIVKKYGIEGNNVHRSDTSRLW